jgi:putative spermidine/putrescine transport system permease protein
MPTTIRRIVLPNIRPGLVTGSILVFATSFGEFAVVQVLVGGNFETVPLWQADALYSATPRFAQLAASSFATFAILFALSSLVSFMNRGRVTRIVPAAALSEERPE